MDTVSLLVYRRVHAAGTWVLVAGLVALGLVLLGVVVLGLDAPVHRPPADPLLGPFRWRQIPFNVA